MITTYLDRRKVIPVRYLRWRETGLESKDDIECRTLDDKHTTPVYGWFTQVEGNAFREIAKSVHNGTIAHIGTYEGLSLSYIFPACKKSGTTIYAIDRWYHPLLEGHLMLWGNGKDTVIMVTKTSKQAVQMFKDNTLDVVFIDACHAYECVYEDLKIWTPRLRDHAILCGHDYAPQHPGVVQAINDVIGWENIQSATNFQDAFWWVVCTPEIKQRIAAA